ncbi:uncharacterized protein V6R79_008748 [Siganus canaliculatus]
MGSEEKAAATLNATFIRPAKFYLNGFSNIPHVKFYYVFLCFVYIITVFGNGLLLSVIYLVKTLHTPKYMIVFNLALTDLCGSTALIPKLLDTFLFDNRNLGKHILVMGSEEKAAATLNATFIRPAKFYLNGFSNIPHVKFYYVFLCFVYIITVFGNGLLLSVIYLVKTLHTPKYMIIFNLALTDLCGSTALIPKLLDTFLFDNRYIAYEACLAYMFFVLFFTSMQSWTLVTMSYDRFIAICFPLRNLGKRILVMGSEEKAAATLNATFIRPAKFYLNGFSNIPHVKFYYVFLCFVYIITVFGNGLLLSVIYLVKTLHTPKYMIVFNLALTDLCGSTALIPKLLDTFLFDNRYIPYEACLAYMFFVMFLASMQSWTLVTMSYDRFIAIYFPLRYHSIVTKQSIAALLLVSWIMLSSLWASTVKLIDRLSFCRSLVVESFFCDHFSVFVLACNDKSLNSIVAYVAFTAILCVPLILIGLTYVSISVALSKIASGKERLKALKTCTSHLILVAIFFLPILSTNIASVTSYIHPNARIVNASLTQALPALLNPIVYSLKTEEVLNSIKKLFKRNKSDKITLP